MVSRLMRGGATPTTLSPQWTLVVGGYPVGSRATLTWLNASVPVRSSRMHRLEGCVKRAVFVVSRLMRGGATPTTLSPQWALVVGGYPVGSRATLTWLNASVPVRSSRMHCLESTARST